MSGENWDQLSQPLWILENESGKASLYYEKSKKPSLCPGPQISLLPEGELWTRQAAYP